MKGQQIQMHRPESIRRVDQIFVGRSIELPERPGVYAFWWVAPRADLIAANRHIVLKGPGERPVDVVLATEFGRPLVVGILGRRQYGSAA